MLPIAHHANVEPGARVIVEVPAVLLITIMLVDDVPAIVTAFVIVNDDIFINNGAFKFKVAIVKVLLNLNKLALLELPLTVTTLYDLPAPPMNVLSLLGVAVKTTLEPLALKVSLVTVPLSHGLPFTPVIVNVPLPRFIVLVPVPELLHDVIVMFGLLALKSSVIPIAPQVSDVIVFVPLIVAATVQVPAPELASNVTVSVEAGTLAPPAPPVVADQFVVAALSHVPVPPTQNLLAMA